MLPTTKRYARYGIYIAVIGAVIISFAIEFAPNSMKRAVIGNPTARHFIHTYHSLRKLTDLAFLPYWFRETELPVYSLTLNEADIKILESALPQDPIYGQLSDTNKVSVKALFTAEHYTDEVEVRYRGTNPNHWNSRQRSWRINFPRRNFYNGMSGINFIIPQDRGYAIELLNMHRARKLGLHSPTLHFARLRVNDKDAGVYLASENWSREWLEKNGMPPEGSNLLTVNDAHPDFRNISIFTPEGAFAWKSYTRETELSDTGERERRFPEVDILIEILTHADDETFAALIPHLVDIKKTYAWSVVNILAKSSHQTDFNNSIFFFNNATGKFEPIAWDVGFGRDPRALLESRTLEKRILAIPQFRKERDNLLRSYINDEKQLEDDLAFYDKTAALVRPEFLGDNEKLENNIAFLLTLRGFRNRIIENFRSASLALNEHPSRDVLKGEKGPRALALPEGFHTFAAIAQTSGEFLENHPQFYRMKEDAIALGPGRFSLRETVIIPRDTTMVIQPGTEIFMGNGVSVISYSPIHAEGTPTNPITIRALSEETPFGVVAVVGTGEEKSTFRYLTMSGGSGTFTHGIRFTGMLSLHEADGEIIHSSFTDTADDDAINFKYGTGTVRHSVFNNTFSDAIDFDYNDGLIGNNIFLPPIGQETEAGEGDAIDVSFSTVVIENNDVYGCGDKGISIGEKARPTVKNNTIKNCPIGIAVKDQAHAEIEGGAIEENAIGISLYQKKEIFGGATANIADVIFQRNGENIIADHVSTYETF